MAGKSEECFGGAAGGGASGGGGGASSSGCGTPRHHWGRSISWTPRSREREAEPAVGRGGGAGDGGSAGDGGGAGGGERASEFARRTQLLCPPLSTLSVSRRADWAAGGDGAGGGRAGGKNPGSGGGEGNAGSGAGAGAGAGGAGEERSKLKKLGRGRNGLDIKLDLGAVRQVNFQDAGGEGGAEPSDSELSQKREKMAVCEKQCSRMRGHLYFGSSLVAQDFELLRGNKITHIVNCVGYVCNEHFPHNFHYRVLWLQDCPSEDIFSVLYDCFDYFEDVKDQGGRVYVHCCQGVSRSAAIVIAYLMWREGRTFEDVFDDVKSLRSVTSPNMGFVFQLMNWQSRVLGSPRTPSLRMYRLAPHSPYDPLHQVPKMVPHPSLAALDSRGAFVVQFANRLYIWLGKLCGRCMAAAADKVAFQLIRYERAPGPAITTREGSEPPELYQALMNRPLGPGPGAEPRNPSSSSSSLGDPGRATLRRVDENSPSASAGDRDGGARGARTQQQHDSAGNSTTRLLVNHAYDADFDAFDKARSGEVLASLPDGTNLRGWDGRWNTPRHDFCCGVPSSRIKR